jgi:hypothetical protein
MIVVTIIGILAGIAVISWRKTNTQASVDNFANLVRNTFIVAGRRAAATGVPFMVRITSDHIQYCQVNPDPTVTSLIPPISTSQVDCSSLPASLEVGPNSQAPSDAIVQGTNDAADVIMPGGVYTQLTPTAIGTGKTVFFGPGGTVDSSLAQAISSGSVVRGQTVYVRRATVDETNKRRRIVVYGVSGRPRVVDNW